MKNFNKLLFPVDLSDTSPKLVSYVSMVAEKFKSEIHILFVARIFDYFSGLYVSNNSINEFHNEIVEGAEKRLYEFKDQYFSDFPNIKTTVELGDISEEILSYATAKKINLIIMGTHGRKGLDKIMFGSVAERVMKNSPVPVLTVNPFKIKKNDAEASDL